MSTFSTRVTIGCLSAALIATPLSASATPAPTNHVATLHAASTVTKHSSFTTSDKPSPFDDDSAQVKQPSAQSWDWLPGGEQLTELIRVIVGWIMNLFFGGGDTSPGDPGASPGNPGTDPGTPDPNPGEPQPFPTGQPDPGNPGTDPGNPGTDPGQPNPGNPNPGNPGTKPTPTITNNPNPTPQPDPGGLDPELAKVLQLVNAERAKGGLRPLAIDPCLSSKVAQTWAQSMANTGNFNHQDLSVVSRRCPGFSYAGENIAMGQRDAAAVMNSWMNSSGHRANIMRSNYTHIGLGLARNSRGTPYWVQNFSARR